MFNEETITDMPDEEKIEKTSALNDIANIYDQKSNDILKGMHNINKIQDHQTDIIMRAADRKKRVLEDDLDFQEKLQDRMLNSIRKMNELDKELNQKEAVLPTPQEFAYF